MTTIKTCLPKSDWQEKLFLNDKFSDCSVLVNTSGLCTRFPGHKIILALASEVFAEKLEHPSENDKSVIMMEDVNPHAVAKVLEYVYLGNIQFSDWKFASDVTKIATTYKMMDLLQHCACYLRNNITLQNVCSLLEVAIFGNLEEFEEECKSVCREGGFVILDTIAFNDSNPDIVKTILSIPDLQVKNEMSVFKAVWKWATYRCCKKQKTVCDENVVDEMSSLFECIRFECMSENETISLPTDLLKRFLQNHDKNDEDKDLLANISDLKGNKKTSTELGSGEAEFSSQQLAEGRNITFPLRLLHYSKSFQFHIEHDKNIHLTGNITLMRFVVKARAYLKSINCDFVVTKVSMLQNLSFRIHNKRGILISFSETIDSKNPNAIISATGKNSNFAFGTPDPKSFGFVANEPACSTADCTERISKSFHASDLVIIEADEVHTIEVVLGVNHSNFLWPLATLKCKRLGNVELSVQTEKCYGISEMAFIEIP